MQTLEELASQVITLAQSRLMADLRFLSGALEQFQLVPCRGLDAPMAGDGERLYYSVPKLLACFKKEQTAPARMLFHLTLHWILGHPFQARQAERTLWDLSCDLAVERVICQLELPGCAQAADPARREWLDRMAEHCPSMTPQALYTYLMEQRPDDEKIQMLAALFVQDSHALWYPKPGWGGHPAGPRRPEKAAADGPMEDQEEETVYKPQGEDKTEEALFRRRQNRLRQTWKQLARQAETDLKLFGHRFGRRAGALMDSLAPITFETCDYSEFLRRFGAESEVMQVSDEAFDLISYTYGLRIYGNVPLIEPLEYRDDKRIREFVIAIDTSGSVQGEIVQNFLQRTCDVLRQSSSFASRVEIYLIQCDAEVQEVVHLTSLDQLNEWIPHLRIRGLGGTDFRPVFDYVDQLQKKHQLTHLNGLLYFTDGEGTYPEKPPAYKVAFLFNRDDCISPRVPSWAIRAVLTTDQIRLLKEDV